MVSARESLSMLALTVFTWCVDCTGTIVQERQLTSYCRLELELPPRGWGNQTSELPSWRTCVPTQR